MRAVSPRAIGSWIPAAAALVIASVARPAQSTEARFELAWSAPSECPNQAMIERRLEQLLGAPPDKLVARHVRVQATVVERGALYELRLHSEVADAQSGSRELTAESCRELAAAGAVIIALLVNPEALQEHAPREPDASPSHQNAQVSASEPAPGQARVPQRVDPAPVQAEGPFTTAAPFAPPEANVSPAPIQFESETVGLPTLLLGAAAVADLGTLPSVAPGVQVLLGAQWSRIRVEMSGLLLPPRFASAEDNPNKGGSISLWAAALRGCFALFEDEVSFGPCAGVEIGILRGHGRGLRDIDDEHVPWVAAIAGLDLGVPLRGQFSIRLQGLVAVPVARSRFYYLREDGGIEPLHRPAAVAGRLGVALELAF